MQIQSCPQYEDVIENYLYSTEFFLKKIHKLHLWILNLFFFSKWTEMIWSYCSTPQKVCDRETTKKREAAWSRCWLSCRAARWKYQDLSRLRRLRTNHINWKLERGNGHNPHIYHPEGWSVHKFNPAKELENKIDAYKKSGTGKWGEGASLNDLLQPDGWESFNIFYLKLFEIWKGSSFLAPGWSRTASLRSL